MNLLTFLGLVVVIYILYRLLQTYRGMRDELRAIREKCVAGAPGAEAAPVTAPADASASTIADALRGVLRAAASI